jgi:NAD-dependent deacetylase
MEKKKILIFSGAGVDKESGVETFRDTKDGLWNNYKIEDVATIDGWRKNRQLVLDFYNQRRAQLKDVEPNLAHKLIADLEKEFEVTLVTQNVTNLHERAGSTNVIHLHGELTKSQSTFPGSTESYECTGDINLGDKCPRGSQLRPAIVWFGENLNPTNLDKAIDSAKDCDICVIVGTSMQVAPANQIPLLVKDGTPIYYIDPGEAFDIPRYYDGESRWSEDITYVDYEHIQEPATIGMQKLVNILKNA